MSLQQLAVEEPRFERLDFAELPVPHRNDSAIRVSQLILRRSALVGTCLAP